MKASDSLERQTLALSTRRHVLQSAVSFGALASVCAALPRGLRAAPAGSPSCLTILYGAGPGLKFDADYYRDHHLATIMKLYGSSIARFELRTVDTPAPGAAGAAGSPPAARYAAAVNIWIADPEAFEAGNRAHGQSLRDDVPHFTNAPATIQYDSVQGAMGARPAAIKVGDRCLTILYPNAPGVHWDVDYYRAHHMPLIMRLYGTRAIRRFELRKGEKSQTGGQPAFVGTVNIYIESQRAFDAAGRAHGQQLRDDVPHFSSEQPEVYPTTVYGVA